MLRVRFTPIKEGVDVMLVVWIMVFCVNQLVVVGFVILCDEEREDPKVEEGPCFAWG
jgi:hypothetical protein